jgi:hypothetical protein
MSFPSRTWIIGLALDKIIPGLAITVKSSIAMALNVDVSKRNQMVGWF